MITANGEEIFLDKKRTVYEKLLETDWNAQRHLEQIKLKELGADIVVSLSDEEFNDLLISRQKIRDSV